LEAGASVDIDRLTAENPALRGELEKCLSGLELVHRVGRGLREGRAESESRDFSSVAGGELPESIGDFRIVREIGRGGMGIVYEAEQVSLGRRVALKVLPYASVLDAKQVQRFQLESQAAARLRHSHIVSVFSVGCENGLHFYAMQYVEGRPLSAIIRELRELRDSSASRSAPQDVASSLPGSSRFFAFVARLVAQIADALEHAHRAGVVHRDVKPSNILVGAAGEAWLTDFGLARVLGDSGPTRSGDLLGTLRYMSPEQARGLRDADHRVDVYSIGITLYEALTLRTPFEGKSEHDVHRAILCEEPPPPRRYNPRLHRDLETIVLTCLEKHPEKRYASAGALAKDLRRFLRYEPIEARPPSALSRLGRRAWQRRLPLGAASAFAALLFAVFLLAARSREEARRRLETEYGPRVLAAVMKLEQCDLTRKSDAGESPLAVGALNEILAEVGIDPLSAAIAELGEAAAALPRRPEAYYHRARALRIQKRLDEALADLARVAAIDPNFVPAIVLEAAIREKRGELEAGARLRERAREVAKDGWKKAWLRAQDALQSGHWAEADQAFGEIIAIEAPGGEAYLGASFLTRLGRGRARLEARACVAALDDFAVLHDRWPEALEPVLLKGLAYHFIPGLRDEAEALFTSLHEEAPPDRKDEIALAVSQVYVNVEPERALDWYEKVSRGDLREQSKVWLLWVLGRGTEAVEAGKRAIALNPDFPAAYRELGFVLAKLGRYTEAVQYLRTAVERWPERPWNRHVLGQTFNESGRNVEAAAAFEESLKIDPMNSYTHTMLGWVYTQLGELSLAEDHLRRAKELEPRQLDGLWIRGLFLRDQRRFDEALENFDRAIEVNPTFSWPRAGKGLTLERLGRLEEAIAEYRAATARFPPGSGHAGLGRLLEGRGEFDEALGEYVKLLSVVPRSSDGHSGARGLLRKKDVPLAASGIERLVAVLDAALLKDGDSPEILRTSALARIRLSGEDGAAKAIELIRSALSRKGGRDSELSFLLGEILLLAGKPAEAIAVLEPAMRRIHALASMPELLSKCRAALLPRLATPGSVEAAVARREREVLIPGDAVWRYFKGRSEPSEGLCWIELGFAAAGWEEGKSGFGFGDDDDATVLRDMSGETGGYTTVYIRRSFQVAEPGRFERLILSLTVDDGAVVYLNGAEIGRVRARTGARLAHDARAALVAPEPLVAVEFPIDLSRVASGENVLAIQGLNASLSSSDFSLIPVLFGERPRDPSDPGRLREGVEAGASSEQAPGLLAFLDGLLLLEAGKRSEAAEELERAARAFPADPLPHLRLAACLRAAGKARAAEAALRRAIEGGLDDREIWDLWAAVSLADLARSPADVLAGFPGASERPAAGGRAAGAGDADHAADLRWLLDTLAKGDGPRVNCGGDDYVAKDGRSWSRDRFFLSGRRPGEALGNPYEFTLGIEMTEDDVLYQSLRYFPGEHLQPPGYRVPLPPGDYEVTLHFAEFVSRRPGYRSFGVHLEGREALPDYEPGKTGFRSAEAKVFSVRVDDGILDVEFLTQVQNPMVSAIEVRPLPGSAPGG
jgi:serine/threonine protein kinase/predicted Zn-dependent protease